MRIKALKTFIYLAETGCDFDGHKALGIPRSNMWNHINEIESETGLKLIQRQRGNSFLTKEGAAFAPIARKMYNTYEEGLQNIVKEESREIEGNIIISTTMAVATGWLMSCIKDFHTNYPNLKLNVIADDCLQRNVEAGADILFRPIGNNPDLIKKWHLTYEHGLFASEEYLKKKGVPKVPEDLKNHCMMGYGTHEFTHFEEINWHLKGKSWGLPKLVPTLTINSTSSMFSAAEQGIGICSFPVDSNVFYKGNLMRVLPQIKGPIIKAYFCTKQNASASMQKSTYVFQRFFEKYLESIGVKFNVD
ncbi:MAG: LysR family transcriptional regulator [Alphaproteobacteria bacterium]|jgi:DNA-binding transcriptional LysR family regulator|nr:LysR family transcriptional regulator [Alphaproteobacteria bacterium]